jgi:hypothetical protein
MSLINEALKKAQRTRHGGLPDVSPTGEGTTVAKRAAPNSAKSTLLIASGAVVLVVGSMVLTALWFTRTPSAASAAAPKSIAAPAPIVTETKAPVINLSVAAPPPLSPSPAVTAATATPPAAPAQTVTSPPSKPAASPASAAAPADLSPTPLAPTPESRPAPAIAKTPTDASPTPPAPEPKPDEHVQQFIEALRVTGIRASGGDSKVLMNDRVYRVNDIVDRTLGLKLTKVSADYLTFTDANGATYVKYF